MRKPFTERAQEMGLSEVGAHKGLFTYEDEYSQLVYRQLYTGFINVNEEDKHPTDGITTPLLAIYTRPTSDVEFKYAGYVSDFYQFIGNQKLIESVRKSITDVGLPIVRENPILSWDHTRMRNEIIIQSSQAHPHAGDILPVMIVNNSYNGARAATIAFGLAMNYNNNRTIFAFSLGEMRQVHIQNSNTEIRSAIISYMNVFTNDITDMIDQSFNNQVTEDEMLAVLDVIEKYGTKRRDAISTLLTELQPAAAGLPSSWQIFLAIVQYSSFEVNLNIKRLLENAAESVLIVPSRMYNVLDKI